MASPLRATRFGQTRLGLEYRSSPAQPAQRSRLATSCWPPSNLRAEVPKTTRGETSSCSSWQAPTPSPGIPGPGPGRRTKVQIRFHLVGLCAWGGAHEFHSLRYRPSTSPALPSKLLQAHSLSSCPTATPLTPTVKRQCGLAATRTSPLSGPPPRRRSCFRGQPKSVIRTITRMLRHQFTQDRGFRPTVRRMGGISRPLQLEINASNAGSHYQYPSTIGLPRHGYGNAQPDGAVPDFVQENRAQMNRF